MASSWEWKQQHQVLVGILHTEQTAMAWALGLRRLQIPGMILPVAGMPYAHARDVICQTALDNGFDYAFHLDSDVIPPPDAIYRLMSHNLPIVSGVYHRRSRPHGWPVMLKGGGWITQYPPNTLMEVDLVGAGCLLLRRDFLEQLPPIDPERGQRWFDWRVNRQHLLPQGEALSEDFAMCFPKGTWVAGNVIKPIEKVKIGDRIVNHVGAVRKVLDWSTRLYSGRLITITGAFVRNIRVTEGHKFYIRTTVKTGRSVALLPNSMFGSRTVAMQVDVRTKKTLWLEARDIRKGDWLYVPKPRFSKKPAIKTFNLGHYISLKKLVKFPDGRLGYKKTRKDAFRIHPTVKVTPELCRLIGYYIAEGSAPGKSKMGPRHTVEFSFGETELDSYVADCRNLIKSLFGIDSLLTIGGGGAKVTVSSKILGRLFSALGGNGAYNKKLPRFWNRLNRECLTELIKGYWRGDGYFGTKQFSMCTMSEQLARDIQAALLKLEVLCGVRQGPEHQPIYTMCVPLGLSERFSKIVDYDCGVIEPRKQNRYYRETKTHFLVQVGQVKSERWTGQVFNLKVAGAESYTANSVAVHNCLHARRNGWKVNVDTGVQCRHIGLADAGYNSLIPCEATP